MMDKLYVNLPPSVEEMRDNLELWGGDKYICRLMNSSLPELLTINSTILDQVKKTRPLQPFKLGHG